MEFRVLGWPSKPSSLNPSPAEFVVPSSNVGFWGLGFRDLGFFCFFPSRVLGLGLLIEVLSFRV